MTNQRLIRVFVASPGDVKEEREIVKLVVEELNRSVGPELEVRIDCLRWEDHVTPLMGRPEAVVLDQMKLSQWDIFIGVLWLRFGTPTGGVQPSSGESFLSGTEEEFTLAYQAWTETGRPQILMYRCLRSPGTMEDVEPNQFSRVSDFFRRFNYDKEHPGLVRTYKEVNEFERRVREDLTYTLRQLAPKNPAEYGPELNPYHQSRGFLRLFLKDDNQDRNKSKHRSLEGAEQIRLIAYTGNSYLGLVSHKFRTTVMQRLTNGGIFRAVLNNPWTLARLFIALADLNIGREIGHSESENPGTLDPVEIIQRTVGFSTSFRDIIDGYQHLRGLYGERVEVRFSKDVIPATVLLTEDDCYFEPYLHNDFRERMHKHLASFELQMTNESSTYEHLSRLFEFMWGRAETFVSFRTNENRYKEQLIAQIEQAGLLDGAELSLNKEGLGI